MEGWNRSWGEVGVGVRGRSQGEGKEELLEWNGIFKMQLAHRNLEDRIQEGRVKYLTSFFPPFYLLLGISLWPHWKSKGKDDI